MCSRGSAGLALRPRRVNSDHSHGATRMTLSNSADRALRERAEKVIPGGMYGHQSVGLLPDSYPQFFAKGSGAHIWDVDGRKYLDFMCAYGPNLSRICGQRHRRRLHRPARQGRRPHRPHSAAGRAGRGLHRDGHPRRLGAVLQERHGRDLHGHGHRAGAHEAQGDRAGQGRLSRRGALVRAPAHRHHQGRPGQPDLLHL